MEAQEKSPIYKYKSLQKPGRFMTLFCGTVIYGGDYFETTDENIPKGFRDLIKMVPKAEEKKKVITPLKRVKKIVPPVVEKPEVVVTGEDEEIDKVLTEEEKAAQEEQDALEAEELAQAEIAQKEAEDKAKESKEGSTKVFTMEHVARGRYNVYNEAGEPQNEKLLLEGPAKLLLSQLNGTV